MIDRLITKNEIIEEVSEEIGKPFHVVKAVSDFIVKYAKENIKHNPEIIEINFPKLGKFKCSAYNNKAWLEDNGVSEAREKTLFEDRTAYWKFVKKPLTVMLAGTYRLPIRMVTRRNYIVKKIAFLNNEKNKEIFKNN